MPHLNRFTVICTRKPSMYGSNQKLVLQMIFNLVIEIRKFPKKNVCSFCQMNLEGDGYPFDVISWALRYLHRGWTWLDTIIKAISASTYIIFLSYKNFSFSRADYEKCIRHTNYSFCHKSIYFSTTSSWLRYKKFLNF